MVVSRAAAGGTSQDHRGGAGCGAETSQEPLNMRNSAGFARPCETGVGKVGGTFVQGPQLMRAKEVRQVIRSVFADWCRAHGFRRTKGHDPGWYHPVEEHFFVVKFWTGLLWSEHWGGGVNCSVSVRDQIQRPLGPLQPVVSRPIVSLVSDADRETMRHWYNEAAARTTIPEESDDPLAKIERGHAETLKIPLVGPLSAEHDFPMRFHCVDDLRRWAKFVTERLPDWLRVLTADWSASPHRANLRPMKLHQPFQDAIRADPESDAPRLAYADWLDQRGAPWADVIRIQCRYADGEWPYNLPWETRVRFEELMQAHQHQWDRGADDLGVKVWFQRGMVEGVHSSAAKFLEAGKRLLEVFPLIHMVEIYGIQGRGAKLAASREPSVARSLELRDLADDDGERIVRSPHLTRVEKLWIALPRRSIWLGSWTYPSRGDVECSTCPDRNSLRTCWGRSARLMRPPDWRRSFSIRRG